MADQEEVASSQSIRRSTRTIRRPPRYTEAEEDSAVEGALVLTIEDPCQGGGHNASLVEEVIENHERVKGVGGGKDLIPPFSFVFTYVIDLSFLVSKSGQ